MIYLVNAGRVKEDLSNFGKDNLFKAYDKYDTQNRKECRKICSQFFVFYRRVYFTRDLQILFLWGEGV